MSCNITAGISNQCAGQVGGIVGIHYHAGAFDGDWDRVQVERDANGVIIRLYEDAGGRPVEWGFIDCSNSMGSCTETYNVGGTGSILGFHQSATCFIPTTANLLLNPANQTINHRMGSMARHNNMIIGIETGDNAPMLNYSKKCFVFGIERPAYCASGSKETGISYTDNNGYTMEFAADSKTPMEEIAYMAMHSFNLKSNVIGTGGVNFWNSSTAFNLEPLIVFEGANISQISPGVGAPIYINVMPGELLSVEVQITMDWLPDAFSGTTFLPEWQIGDGFPTAPMSYTNTTTYPIPTAPGPATIQVKGNLTNTTSIVQPIIPVRMPIPAAPGVTNVNNLAVTPVCRFLTITRTT